jgi:hypothetical protein
VLRAALALSSGDGICRVDAITSESLIPIGQFSFERPSSDRLFCDLSFQTSDSQGILKQAR